MDRTQTWRLLSELSSMMLLARDCTFVGRINLIIMRTPDHRLDDSSSFSCHDPSSLSCPNPPLLGFSVLFNVKFREF